MTGRVDPPRNPQYATGFTLTAVVLGGLTLLLVLVVLPRRYLLSAGLRESGVSFPSRVAPFHPPEEEVREAPPLPSAPLEVPPGPAEAFWQSVMPLLEGERFKEAIPHFRAYLRAHPDDRSVAREYALTLIRAGHTLEAIGLLQRLLSEQDDPDLRLILARTQRDLGLLDDASLNYSVLVDQNPDDPSTALEWGRALAWDRRYMEAIRVLELGLDRDPVAPLLRLELARIHYWAGNLDAADQVLAGLEAEAAGSPEARTLQGLVASALTPPEVTPDSANREEVPPPTLLEEALRAQAEGDFERAAGLYRRALREAPEDPELWMAYADLLQYHLDDMEKARNALLQVEALEPGGLDFRFRLAQLSLWTGRNDDAENRLESLLKDLKAGAEAPAEAGSPESREARLAEVHALLGDLYRWKGDRKGAARHYRIAQASDLGNRRAEAGMREMEEEAAREIVAFEEAGFGGDVYSITDSDEFSRLDLGADGNGIDGDWVWGVRTGSRWMQGSDLVGGKINAQGFFLESELAHWWALGTIRSGLHVGLEEMQPGQTDPTLGASIHFSDLAGFRTDLRYDHGPAYPITLTLQSMVAGVGQDRFRATMARRLGTRWSLSLAGDAALITSPGTESTQSSSTLRMETGISLGKSLTDALTLGLNARGMAFTEPSPVVDGLRLFWDPRGLVAGGLFAYFEQPVADRWRVEARLNPGVAYIDERRGVGRGAVPHLSAEGGLSHLGARMRTDLDLFYYQGRFDGYRSYGLRLSFTTTDLSPGRK